MVEIRVLGAFEARVGGLAADLGGTRQRAVLARLAVARGRMVPVERLIDDLWPEEAPPRALAGVQSFVSHLRKVLEPGRPPRTPAQVLVTEPPGYALRLSDAGVDAWRFESLVRESAEPSLAWERADEALVLWRGPAYAEFADLHWAGAESARLSELRLTAIERRAEAMLERGAAAQAVPDLEAHTTAHPLREEPWRLLSLALYRTGRQADALAALRRIRTLLADELGVDPGAPLQALERDILLQSPGLDSMEPAALELSRSGRAEVEASPVAGELFVGREDELARIVRGAREGARIALVSGEAGAGKSALAEKVCAELGWRQAWGRTPETDGAPAAWAWAELLRALDSQMPVGDGSLAAMLDDDALAPVGDLTVARFRLHRAIGDFLANVAARTPLVLVLEDLHRADEETLALLASLPGRLRNVLIVGTYRPSEVSGRFADTLAVLAKYEPVRIELGGLGDEAVARLVQGLCEARVDAETLRVIGERTSGNPFFVRETARLLDAEGAEAALRDVPSGVGDILRRRVARLPAFTQTVLRHAAVAGRDIDPDLLTEVTAADPEAVLDALEAALLTGLITETDQGVRFAHVLIRDTLYGELSRLRRARLHARVADALEARPGADPALLVHHHLESGTRLERAVHHARRAAEVAESRFAHTSEAALWQQALTAFDRAGGPVRERLELEIRLIRAWAMTGEVMKARAQRATAIEEARPLDDAELMARLLTAFDVPTLWTSRRYGTREDSVIEAAEHAIGGLADRALRCRALTTLAMELDGEPGDRGLAAATEAVALARELDVPELLVHALNGLYLNSYDRAADLSTRDRIAAEILAVAERHDLGLHQVLGHMFLQQTATGRLDFAAARHHLAEGRRLARRYDLPLLGLIGEWHHALRHAMAGRFDEALEVYQSVAEQIMRISIWGGEAGIAWIGLFTVRYAQGRLAELLDEAHAVYEMWRHANAITDLYALILASAGKLEEARLLASEVVEVRDDYFKETHLAVRALLHVTLGKREGAADVYEQLLPYADGYVGMSSAVVALCPAALVLGDLAELLGTDPSHHYRQAAEVARRVGAPHWEQEALSRGERGPVRGGGSPDG